MINFVTEDISFTFKNKTIIKKWIKEIIESYKKKLGDISVVFVSDKYLLEINQKYLNHNYYTDIITFDNSHNDYISGDLLISIERVEENATLFKKTFQDELHRVIAHGVLHLLGFSDDTDEKRFNMRKLEDNNLLKLNI